MPALVISQLIGGIHRDLNIPTGQSQFETSLIIVNKVKGHL